MRLTSFPFQGLRLVLCLLGVLIALPDAALSGGSVPIPNALIQKKEKKEKKKEKDEADDEKESKGYTPAERDQLLDRATAVVRGPNEPKDPVAGPPGAPLEYDPGRGIIPNIRLEYRREKDPGGKTRKFWARDSEKTKWKVKYRSEELHTEVAATRLMWLMGYAADHVYPAAEVTCVGCRDDDPWKSMDRASADPVEGREVTFREVSLERSIQHFLPGGDKIEAESDQGVALDELDDIVRRIRQSEPERAAELDSLKALAFMLQHSDSKPENQRLVGVRWPDVEPAEDGFNQVLVVLQDVGASFGRGRGTFKVSKLNFKGWKDRMSKPWASGMALRLPKSMSADGGWKNPTISPEGLRFFLQRAERLSRDDLVAVFRAARFPEASGVSAEEWARAWESGIQNLKSRADGR